MRIFVEEANGDNETDFASGYRDLTIPALYSLTVNGGFGGGSYMGDAQVMISAYPAPNDQVFDKWTATGGGTLANATSPTTTFTMSTVNAIVTATYKPTGTAGTYALTVTGGSGSGNYAAGQSVTITANPPPAGQVFDKWTATGGGFADATAQTTNFTMPASA
ncbi:MAG: hypothetical protein LBB75_01245, partial [Oscillospiraceae bacterium]|nr:hypothetical protein [Oscillospiraceae bacterium]